MDDSIALPKPQGYQCTHININVVCGQLAESSFTHKFPNSHHLSEPANDISNAHCLSSEENARLAGTQRTQASSEQVFSHASYFAIPALPRAKHKGPYLFHLLSTSAEMVSKKQYERAMGLLWQCKYLSSQSGDPLQRVAYYFSEALQQRIQRETDCELEKARRPELDFAYNVESNYDRNKIQRLMAFGTRALPYDTVLQFTAVQAVMEVVGNAKKIHVIDLGIRTGCQWTSLIYSLSLRSASSRFKSLNITAVGMNAHKLQDSGRRLREFAESMAVPFSYNLVKISNVEEIKEGLFNVKPGEVVVVYAPTVLRSLLYNPVLLGHVVTVIKKLRPRIMVSAEIEGKHNSPCFVNRFKESLSYYSAYFESLEKMVPQRNDLKRVKFEEAFCRNQIINMIACRRVVEERDMLEWIGGGVSSECWDLKK